MMLCGIWNRAQANLQHQTEAQHTLKEPLYNIPEFEKVLLEIPILLRKSFM